MGLLVSERLQDLLKLLKAPDQHLPGFGTLLRPDNAGRLLALTGVGEVHGSCKVRLPDGTVQTSPSLVEHLIDNTRI